VNAVTLMYHDVIAPGREDGSGFPGGEAARYKITLDVFASHLRAIRARTHRRPVTVDSVSFDGLQTPDLRLKQGLPQTSHPKRTPQRPSPDAPLLLLTFDDGGSSAEAIAECLEVFGWRGHFFVTTNYIDRSGFVTRDVIRRLRKRGHVIGSHSCTHPLRMARCSPPRLREEWTRSAETLADVLGEPTIVASVPGGDYSAIVADAAAGAGIRVLFTSRPSVRVGRRGTLNLLGRFVVRRSTTPDLVAAVAAGGWAPRMKQLVLWDLKAAGKAIASSAYERIRARRLGRSADVKWGDDLVSASEDPSQLRL
jgi:peptidoglycan/xylan/chitin deacetylase (PgdA/CDA1 family)